MDFWGKDLIIRDTLENITKVAESCVFHKMLLESYIRKNGNMSGKKDIEVRRDGSALMISGLDTPILSICRTPGEYTCSLIVLTDKLTNTNRNYKQFRI